MSGTYAFGYVPNSVYSHVVELVQLHAGRSGVHLDIGCGFGAIAEPVRDLGTGLTYVGIDGDHEGTDNLRTRGFDSYVTDLHDLEQTREVLLRAIDGRPLASITMLDTLEHLLNGPAVLAMLQELATSLGPVPLILSIPNVTHFDLGAKLLTARWDVTAAGLLDQTHIAFYSESRLRDTMRSVGWIQVDEQDFRINLSDQHFPTDSIVLNPETTLGRVLHDLRRTAGDDYNVNQFVRAYLPTVPREVELLADGERDRHPDPFLSVVIRSQGRRLEMLRDALLCLAAQTTDDFEVVLVLHKVAEPLAAEVQAAIDEQPSWLRDRIRIVREPTGGRAHPLNTGFLAARGRYICALDDDDLVFAHWVQTYVELGRSRPGRVLRVVAVEQDFTVESVTVGGDLLNVPVMAGEIRAQYPERFNLLDHTVQNRTPLMAVAFPRQLFSELGLRFDESLPVCEDWDLLLRSALICGVADAPEATALYRRWDSGDSSLIMHSEREWIDAATSIQAKLDRSPLTLPPGYLTQIRALVSQGSEQVAQLTAQLQVHSIALQATDQRLLEVFGSTSWRVTRPLRGASRALRFVKRKMRVRH